MKALFIILPIVLLIGFIFWAFIAFKPNENGKSISFDGLDRNIKVIINNSKIDDLDVCNGEVYVYGDILGDVDVTNGDIRCRNIAGDIDQTNGDIYKN